MPQPKIRKKSFPNANKESAVVTLSDATKHFNVLGERLNALRCSERSTDVRLLCHFNNAAKIVNCHELQLASISSYLKSLFEQFKERQPGTKISITLTDFDAILVEKLMQIVYTGKAELENEGQVEDLRVLAKTFQLDIDLKEDQEGKDEEGEQNVQDDEEEKSEHEVDNGSNEKGNNVKLNIKNKLNAQSKLSEKKKAEDGKVAKESVTSGKLSASKETKKIDADSNVSSSDEDETEQVANSSSSSTDEVDDSEARRKETDLKDKARKSSVSIALEPVEENKDLAETYRTASALMANGAGAKSDSDEDSIFNDTTVFVEKKAPEKTTPPKKIKEGTSKVMKNPFFSSTAAPAASSQRGKRRLSEMDKRATVAKEPKKMRAEEDTSNDDDNDLRDKRRQEVSIGLVKPGDKAKVEKKTQKPGPKSKWKNNKKEMPQAENADKVLDEAQKESEVVSDNEQEENPVANKGEMFITEDNVTFCDLCGAIFLKSSALKEHMKNEHPDNSDSDDDEELLKSQNNLSLVSTSSLSPKKASSEHKKPSSESSKKSSVDTPKKPSLEPSSSSASKKKSAAKIREERMREQSKRGSPICNSDASDNENKEPPMKKKLDKGDGSVHKKGQDPSKATPRRRQRSSSSSLSSSDDEHSRPKGLKFKIRLANPAFKLKNSSSKSATPSNSAASSSSKLIKSKPTPLKSKEPKTSNLSKSESSTHSGEREIECLLCSYRATNQSGIKNHVVNHYKEKLQRDLPSIKPFSCPIDSCNQVSRDKISLLRHYAFKHQKILDYCEEKHLKGKPIGQNVDEDSHNEGGKSNGIKKRGRKPKTNAKSAAVVQSGDNEDDEDQNDKQTKKDDSDDEERKKSKKESEDNVKKLPINNAVHFSDSSDDSLSQKSSAIAANALKTFDDLLSSDKDKDDNKKKEENNENDSKNSNDYSQDSD